MLARIVPTPAAPCDRKQRIATMETFRRFRDPPFATKAVKILKAIVRDIL